MGLGRVLAAIVKKVSTSHFQPSYGNSRVSTKFPSGFHGVKKFPWKLPRVGNWKLFGPLSRIPINLALCIIYP
jgi:hypothetical protein